MLLASLHWANEIFICYSLHHSDALKLIFLRDSGCMLTLICSVAPSNRNHATKLCSFNRLLRGVQVICHCGQHVTI